MPSPFFIGTTARFRGASWFDYSVADWTLKGIKIGNKSSNACNAVGANIPQRVAFVGMARNSLGAHRRGSAVLPLWALYAFCASTPGTDAPNTDRGPLSISRIQR